MLDDFDTPEKLDQNSLFDKETEAEQDPQSGTEPVSFSIEDVLSRSWEILRFGSFPAIATIWAGIFLGFLPVFIMSILTTERKNPQQPPGAAAQVLVFLAFGVSILQYAGLSLYLTNLAAGRRAGFGDLFRCRKFAWAIILAYFLVGLTSLGTQFLFVVGTLALGELIGDSALLIGFFLGVPVLYAVMLSLSQVPFLIVDREVGPMGALQMSWFIMRGHRLTYFFLTAICGIINLFGLMALGFGLLITFPLYLIAIAVFYLAVTGQPVADPFGWRRKSPQSQIDA